MTSVKFAGYTSRVADFFHVLEDVNYGKFERTMVSADSSEVKKVVSRDILGKVVLKDKIIQFEDVPM